VLKTLKQNCLAAQREPAYLAVNVCLQMFDPRPAAYPMTSCSAQSPVGFSEAYVAACSNDVYSRQVATGHGTDGSPVAQRFINTGRGYYLPEVLYQL